jgi:choline dehydrogenase-like flavoprotein
MLSDARTLPSGSTISGDVCVIGAGPAGLTVTRGLAGMRVVLLESGGRFPSPEAQELAKGDILGESYWALETSRLRCLGGTTGHWTGWCRPLDADDFARRDWIADSGWPLHRDELEPYYREAQVACDLGPFDYDAARWAQRLGTDLLPLDRAVAETAIFQMSAPTRFGEKYASELETSPSIDAYHGATVVELSTSRSGERVEEVRAVAAPNGAAFRVRAKAFVLAAGGIENARVLLSSGAPRGLGNRSGLVGRYFLEHPHVAVGVLHAENSDALRLYESGLNVEGGKPRALRAAISLTPELRAREQLLGCSLGIEPLPRPLPYGADEVLATRSLARRFQGLDVRRSSELLARAEELPSPESYVRLTAERDALGIPRAGLVWRHHPETLRSIRRTLELVAAALSRAGIGRVYSYMHGEHRVPGAWPEIFGGYHHMGTTRMHDDPRRGVVDRDCRVHFMDNLFVAGSSVFPTGGFANPTLTLVALAARLARILPRFLA